MRTIGLVLGVYVLYCGMLFLQQRRLLFPSYLIPSPAEVVVPARQSVWLELPFGAVETWLLLPTAAAAEPFPAVIYAHGNAELIDHYPRQLDWFRDQGIALFLVEYPGYGRSDGRPSRAALRETFTTAYDHLIGLPQVDQDSIILFGRSIGCAVVADLASARPSRAMIMLSPFTSVQAMARRYLAPGFLVRDRFDNVQAVREYDQPLLVVHGEHDSVIPLRQGRAVAAAAPRGRLVVYDCGHNDCPPDWNAFFQELAVLLRDSGIAHGLP